MNGSNDGVAAGGDDASQLLGKLIEPFLDGSIGAISIDTQAFDAAGDRLDSGRIALLAQFSDRKPVILLSDICVRELKRHLTDKIVNAKSALAKAAGQARDYIGVPSEAANQAIVLLSDDRDAKEIAETRVDGFIKKVNAEVCVTAAFPITQQLLDAYFDVTPPFGTGKKSEFPDALAVLAIEAWAAKNETNVLLVSNDGGWKAYAEQSARLHCVSDIASLLTLANLRNQANDRITEFVSDRFGQQGTAEFEVLVDEVNRQSDRILIEADVRSAAHDCQMDAHDIEVESVELLKSPIKIEQVSAIGAAVEVKLSIDITVTATFEFYAYDSIDKDYIYLDGTEVQQRATVVVPAIISLEGDPSDNPSNFEISGIELLRTRARVDFGRLDPFDDADPDDES